MKHLKRLNVMALLNAGLLCIITALVLRLWKLRQAQKVVVVVPTPASPIETPKLETRTAAFQIPEEKTIVVNIRDLEDDPTTVTYDLIPRKKHHHHF